MTPADLHAADAMVTRCRGCGGHIYRHADFRPCTTCVIAYHRRAIRRAVGE